MRLTEIERSANVFEMPFLTAGQVDWGLEDPVRNARRAGIFLGSPHSIMRADRDGTLYRRLHLHGGGEFAYINDEDGLISYFMEYKTIRQEDFGRCATQVKVWRTVAPGTKGIAEDIFLNVMLHEFDTMVSDRIQTDDGRRFWLQRMVDATSTGMQVGLSDHGKPLRYPRTGWRAWLAQVDGWGKESKHHERLFYISKLP